MLGEGHRRRRSDSCMDRLVLMHNKNGSARSGFLLSVCWDSEQKLYITVCHLAVSVQALTAAVNSAACRPCVAPPSVNSTTDTAVSEIRCKHSKSFSFCLSNIIISCFTAGGLQHKKWLHATALTQTWRWLKSSSEHEQKLRAEQLLDDEGTLLFFLREQFTQKY